jgi:hypothetical protein
MTPELNWAGQPIRAGEGYGGRPENIPKTWGQKPAKPAAKHYEVITKSDVGEVFGFGEHTLTKAEAAKRLQALTGGHRVSCYRSLRRFGKHLHSDGIMLSWRSLC